MANEKRLIFDSEFKLRINAVIENRKRMGLPYDQLENVALGLLDCCPTVDAVEVVHARWNPIRNFGGGECYGYCTNCKTPVKADNATGLVMSNRFCHWCGAKMDGGNEDG